MKSIITLLFLFVFVGVQAQSDSSVEEQKRIKGNGDVVTEQRALQDFDGIVVCCNILVLLTESEIFSVKVKAESNVMEYVRTKVSNGILTVNLEEGVKLKKAKPVVVYVSLPTFRYIEVSGSSRVAGGERFTGTDLELVATDRGSIEVDFFGARIWAVASNRGKVELSGRGRSVDIKATSGGLVWADYFRSDNGSVNASSGAEIRVSSAVLDIQASTGGNVFYRYKPRIISIAREEGSTVRKVN